MKIFLAGGTGAVGKRLIPSLIRSGHQVVATTRSNEKTNVLAALGAEPVIADGLNRDSIVNAVTAARPDVIVHQMTSLAGVKSLRNFDGQFAGTNRLRTEGTRYLLEAARAAGTKKLVVQSFCGWPSIREGGRVKTEDDPLDPNLPATMRQTLDAIRQLESLPATASGITAVVLRYGNFYGPGTDIAAGGEIVEAVRKHKFPIVGDGNGVWSFIHTDDVAEATRLAVEHAAAGVYNVVDDDPAEVRLWLPELARILGAKPPARIPAWLGRLFIGSAGVLMMTKIRGASNAKAKAAFGWQPRYPSWREGFRNLGQKSG